MSKSLNILFLILIIIFYFTIYKYFSFSKHLDSRNYNRNNINQIIKDKTSDLPILDNNTNNVISFNDSISNELEEEITERKKAEEELDKYRINLEHIVEERTSELTTTNSNLQEKNKRLAHYNELFVNREFRIKELKEKLKEYERKK